MKRKSLKIMVAALAVAMTAGIFTGCSNKNEGDKTGTTPEATKMELSGSITAAGSTALQPLAELGAKNFADVSIRG